MDLFWILYCILEIKMAATKGYIENAEFRNEGTCSYLERNPALPG
jgi:hypothetical protein